MLERSSQVVDRLPVGVIVLDAEGLVSTAGVDRSLRPLRPAARQGR
jgi:hypothetical protein